MEKKHLKHFSLQRQLCYGDMGVKGTVTLTFRRKDAFFYIFNSKAAIWILLKFSKTFHRHRNNLENCRIHTLLRRLSFKYWHYNNYRSFYQGNVTTHQILQRAHVPARQPPTNGHVSVAKLVVMLHRKMANYGIWALLRVLAVNVAHLTKTNELQFQKHGIVNN